MTRRPTAIRLYVDAPLQAGARLALDARQSNYLANVMRLKPGDRLGVFNGRDGDWLAEVAEARRRAASLAVVEHSADQQRLPDLWLCLAPIRKARIDWVVEKATELGVARVQLVATTRTVVDRVNLDRLKAHAIEAAEQCGGNALPEIVPPAPLDRTLADWPAGRRLLFCDEDRTDPPVATALADAEPGPWAVLIGPEGGFEARERALIRSRPFVAPASLGPRVLRAETAALAAVALWQAVLGDWGRDT